VTEFIKRRRVGPAETQPMRWNDKKPCPMNFTSAECEELKAKLLDNIVEQEGPLSSRCWIWQRANANGYGVVCLGHRSLRAHRVAYRVFVGRFDEEMQINHHCDERACLNPDHLYVGTQQDNMDDMITRERTKPSADLTNIQVVEALEMLNEGHSQVFVAKHFDVSQMVINSIAKSRTWRHIPGPRPTRTYTSHFKGVSRGYKDKWQAHTQVNGRQLRLGLFATEEEAAAAYNTKVLALGLKGRPLNQFWPTTFGIEGF
jgi:hypothetical protein